MSSGRRWATPPWLLGLVGLAAVAILMVAVVAPHLGRALLGARLGIGDFQAYWSASRLLSTAQNFADPDLLLAIEREHTGWTRDYAMVTWNPPWLLVLLLPYALLPFPEAAGLWLLTNVTLIFVASVMVWKVVEGPWRGWVAPILTLVFAPALVGLSVGQVVSLVYFGLAGFLFFERRDRPLWAGACLALTLVKPHLVYVTLPVILLELAYQRRWRVWAGLAGALALSFVAFLLRPTLLADYAGLTSGAHLLAWQTPTLGGFLELVFGWRWSKLMGLVVLPLALIAWWQRRGRLDVLATANVTLILSVPTAPFGWGYDALVLVLPILQVFAWVFDGRLERRESAAVVALIAAADIVSYRLRLVVLNEVYYFWLPLVVAGLYGWAAMRKNGRAERTDTAVSAAAGTG